MPAPPPPSHAGLSALPRAAALLAAAVTLAGCSGASAAAHHGAVATGAVQPAPPLGTPAPTPDAGFSMLPQPPSPPGPRSAGALAYDGVNHRMLLFGGRDARGAPIGGSWEWNAAAWGRIDTPVAPSPRVHPAMAWDPQDSDVVLFGDAAAPHHPGLTDTWLWSGSAWREANPEHAPAAAADPQLCWDDATHQLVLVGVRAASAGAWQTWTWSGGDWHLQAAGATPDATGASCAYDSDEDELLFTAPSLQGAGTANTGVDAWTGSAWHPIQAAAPGPGAELIPEYAEHTVVAVTATHATYVWLGPGFGLRHGAGDAAVLDDSAYGYYPALSLVVAVGGLDAQHTPSARVATWNGSQWNALG